MAVTIQIDVERLNEPTVAKALANLVLALGGSATGQARPAAEAPKAPALAPAAPAPAPAAAAPAAAPKAEPKSRGGRRKAAAAPKAAPAAPAATGDAAERYRAFVAKLPPRSRAFLDLVRDRGTVNITDAMKALDISVPKAMGGITGSIGRWAPARGVTVPYSASMVDGLRTWTWTGSPVDGEAAPAAPAKAEQPAAKGRKSTRKASPKKGGRKARTAKAKPAPSGDEATRYAEFVANLPPRSQKFLELVSTRKTLTIGEAMEALGIEVPKAMGGITGSIGRWAPVRGLTVPYKAITINGERAWQWLGAPGEAEGASPKAEAPAGVNTPTGAKATELESKATEQAEAEAAAAAREAAIDGIIAGLPDRSSLFVRTLRQRGELTMPDVLQQFSLAKARAVAGIVDPVIAAFEAADIEVPFLATFASTGDKAWLWPRPGAADDTTAADEPTPAAARDDAERGVSAARPGVRVRRRAR